MKLKLLFSLKFILLMYQLVRITWPKLTYFDNVRNDDTNSKLNPVVLLLLFLVLAFL